MKTPSKGKVTKPTSRTGRPKGALTVYCVEGAPLRENESRARYGKGSLHVAKASAAAGWVQQLGIALEDGPAPALRFIRDQLSNKILDRFRCHDVSFFENFAAAMRLPIGEAQHPQHASLISYVRRKQEANRAHLFSRAELRDAVTWPKGYGMPDDRTLGRLTKLLGVPMQKGAPKKSRQSR